MIFSAERGPMVAYDHIPVQYILGDESYNVVQRLWESYSTSQIVLETLWGVKDIVARLRCENYIYRLDVFMKPRDFFTSHTQGYTDTRHHGDSPLHIQIYLNVEAMRGPFHIISTIFHEMAHALEPCQLTRHFDHDPLWVNVYANLVREMTRMQHGPCLQKIYSVLQSHNMTWSDVLKCFSVDQF